MTRYLVYARGCLVWLALRVGYAIRPYDMLADRRRWRWQPATRCWRCWP